MLASDKVLVSRDWFPPLTVCAIIADDTLPYPDHDAHRPLWESPKDFNRGSFRKASHAAQDERTQAQQSLQTQVVTQVVTRSDGHPQSPGINSARELVPNIQRGTAGQLSVLKLPTNCFCTPTKYFDSRKNKRNSMWHTANRRSKQNIDSSRKGNQIHSLD